jgi:hypothetical protein
MMRWLNTLFRALQMTAQGRTPDTPAYRLSIWCAETVRLVDAAFSAADAEGLLETERRAQTLTVEGRRTNLQTILATIRFHAAEEYPALLRDPDANSLAAIQASNANDLFLTGKITEIMISGKIKGSFTVLQSHLLRIPDLSN